MQIRYCEDEDSMKRKIAAMVLCLIWILGLGGCSLLQKKYTFVAEKNSIFVHADGQITAAIIEDFDKDYYDLAELTGLAQQQVLNYNQTYYAMPYYSYDQMSKEEKRKTLLPISLQSIEEKNGQVILTIVYMNGDTYTGFNGIDLQKSGGTKVYTAGVTESTIPLSGTSFVAARGGASQSTESLSRNNDLNLLYVDYGTIIYFEHDISYVSSNVTVLSGNAVQTPAGQDSFVLFK